MTYPLSEHPLKDNHLYTFKIKNETCDFSLRIIINREKKDRKLVANAFLRTSEGCSRVFKAEVEKVLNDASEEIFLGSWLTNFKGSNEINLHPDIPEKIISTFLLCISQPFLWISLSSNSSIFYDSKMNIHVARCGNSSC